jgi:LysR family transcriptional regulator, nitrogen assimilation regulatory protein
MDLRQLRYFIAIVEQGSFSRAAETLSIAQPALSLHVRNMEAELGTALLFRTPQGVIATDAGKVLLHHARIVIGQISIAQEEIKNQQTEPRGEVSLGLPGTISQILSVPLIIESRKRFPKVKLRIAEAMSGFVLDWMRNDQVDLAVVYVPVSEKSVTSSPVLTEELWLLGPPGQSLDASSDRANFDMIAQLPLILPSTNHGLRILLEKEARARSLNLNTAIEMDSYVNIKELVEHGLGYSVLPFNAIAPEVEQGRIFGARIVEPVITRSVYIAHQIGRPMSDAAIAIEALCRATLADLVTTGKWKGSCLA